jgi:hypothetical protein
MGWTELALEHARRGCQSSEAGRGGGQWDGPNYPWSMLGGVASCLRLVGE